METLEEDPLWSSIIDETSKFFSFLKEKYEFKQDKPKVTIRQCSITYKKGVLELAIWCERGCRPEISFKSQNKRIFIGNIIKKCCPTMSIWKQPSFDMEKDLKKYYLHILKKYAEIIQYYAHDILTGEKEISELL